MAQNNASMYAVYGGSMEAIHTWHRKAPRYGGSCFEVAKPMPSTSPLLSAA